MGEMRAMTPEERERLEAELARARESPVSVGPGFRTAAAVLLPWAWKPALLLVAMDAVASALAPAWVADVLWRATGGLALVVVAGLAMLAIAANRAWMGFLERLHGKVRADLEAARVEVRRHAVRAAAEVRVDAEALGHLLEVDGPALIFVPKSLSAGVAGFPGAAVELAFAPATAACVGARASGEPVAVAVRALDTSAMRDAIATPCQPVPGSLAEMPRE